jgi:carbamoylphosphate synthase small subunit
VSEVAVLALEDGSVFRGRPFGARVNRVERWFLILR